MASQDIIRMALLAPRAIQIVENNILFMFHPCYYISMIVESWKCDRFLVKINHLRNGFQMFSFQYKEQVDNCTENIWSYGVKDSIFMSLVLALVLIFVIKRNNLCNLKLARCLEQGPDTTTKSRDVPDTYFKIRRTESRSKQSSFVYCLANYREGGKKYLCISPRPLIRRKICN